MVLGPNEAAHFCPAGPKQTACMVLGPFGVGPKWS